jgi:hypothetical protein
MSSELLCKAFPESIRDDVEPVAKVISAAPMYPAQADAFRVSVMGEGVEIPYRTHFSKWTVGKCVEVPGIAGRVKCRSRHSHAPRSHVAVRLSSRPKWCRPSGVAQRWAPDSARSSPAAFPSSTKNCPEAVGPAIPSARC